MTSEETANSQYLAIEAINAERRGVPQDIRQKKKKVVNSQYLAIGAINAERHVNRGDNRYDE